MKRSNQINLFHDLGLSYMHFVPKSNSRLIQDAADKIINSILVGKKRTTREKALFIEAVARGRFSYMDYTRNIKKEFGNSLNYPIDRAYEIHNSEFPQFELMIIYSSAASGVFWGIERTRKK